MITDSQALALSTASSATAAAYNNAVAAFVGFRANMGQLASVAVKADPGNVMAHVLKASLGMTAFKAAIVPGLRLVHAEAERLAPKATKREQAHVAALGAWLGEGEHAATRIWGAILDEHPHDILAFRLAHFAHFWSGRRQDMLADVEKIVPFWHDDIPGYAALLGCRCFAHEEAGLLVSAERHGRAAIARDPGEVWAAHGVAHVMEMQGRHGEGVTWIERLANSWEGVSNIQHHLWWHCALFRLENGDLDAVLRLYDQKIRNLASPLTTAMPDLYIDVQNAVSLLFRLEHLGADVGRRWEELADHAEARVGDTLSTFTIPHWMLALSSAGRVPAEEAMVAALASSDNPVVQDVAIPIAQAIRARGAGRPGETLDLMRPVLGRMAELGGSHAQQDLLELLFVEAALAAASADDLKLALRRAGGRGAPLSTRVLWREAAALG